MTRMTAEQPRINRRGFLKICGVVGGYAMMPLDLGAFNRSATQTLVEIPPSLMLHSPDGRPDFMPRLLECLQQDGFTATTYKRWYQSVLANRPLPRPVILSIDDISLARSGCASFNTFVQMKEWIQAAGATAVYGVITQPVINGQPQREQDEERWDMIQVWVEAGFELANHTTYHSNFNAIDTGPRADFTAVDYEAEIVQSAQLIKGKLHERQVDYTVETLILPYGSGYSYQLPQPQIHAGIAAACAQTEIKFVIGIPHGRQPLPRDVFNNPDNLLYLGRIPPAYLTEIDGNRSPQAEQTVCWLRSWEEDYHR